MTRKTVLVLAAGAAGLLAGGPGSGVHAAAATALFVAAWSVAGALAPLGPPPGRPSRRPAEELGRRHLVRDVVLVHYALRTAGDVHDRLRPELRRLAAELLAVRHGIDLDEPRLAPQIRELVGPAAWNLIRPDRPAPTRPRAPGLRRAELDMVLAGLERL